MRARLNLWKDQLQTSFWFLPLVMLCLSALLALVLVWVDGIVDPGIKTSIGWAYSGDPQGARSLLSTIAGSMITAASVTFSLASVALSIASQQYGSRVLRNYMGDRITQILLGTFISTFLYSVVVVWNIRGTDPGVGFVPAIAVTVAIGLAVASLVLLIFFVHHISTSIKATHQVLLIAQDLGIATKELYPGSVGKPWSGARPVQSSGLPIEVNCDDTGYLLSVDLDSLLDIAKRQKLLIELCIKPGDYHIAGNALAQAFGTDSLSDKTRRAIRESFIFGGERTPAQDIRYRFRQLTEIVIRALSPAINDPFTALNGIDQLAGALARLTRHSRAFEQRQDEDGTLRLIVPVPGISEILERTVGHIAIYASADPVVMERLEYVLDVVQPDLRGSAELETAANLRRKINEKLRGRD